MREKKYYKINLLRYRQEVAQKMLEGLNHNAKFTFDDEKWL
jgi:hypothetical protein